MKFPGGSRLSPAQGGWLMALLLVAWVGFLFLPKPKPPSQPLPPFEVHPPSKLEQVGLPNNPDLVSLPAVFSLWADKAPWGHGPVFFAYWHPGANDFTYFIEATRTAPDEYRFRLLDKAPPEDTYYLAEPMASDCPIRYFLRPVRSQDVKLREKISKPPKSREPPSRIPMDLAPKPMELQPTETGAPRKG